ncbi:unnamed protein product [Merluccius merluccius]
MWDLPVTDSYLSVCHTFTITQNTEAPLALTQHQGQTDTEAPLALTQHQGQTDTEAPLALTQHQGQTDTEAPLALTQHQGQTWGSGSLRPEDIASQLTLLTSEKEQEGIERQAEVQH